MKTTLTQRPAKAPSSSGQAPPVRFRCRLETSAFQDCLAESGRISAIISRILVLFRQALDEGLFNLRPTSGFRIRPEFPDKVELTLRLRPRDKDLLEKLSFALRRSQAEILRMAVEWYLTCRDGKDAGKWHHDPPAPRPWTFRFSFWRRGRILEWRFPRGPDTARIPGL